ncbi:MAG: ABC transporter substrate-binding protein [Bacteroidetes bacterium]|nr:ABC transporter substrate-binding protein [Bacteroidota bacterium]
MKKQIKNWMYPFIISMGFVLILANGCKKSEDPLPAGGQTINFGALLDLTVNNPQNGLATKAAIQFALEDLNAYAAIAGRNVTFTCSYADTKMDTSEAKNQMEIMYNKGVRMFLSGPYSSSELKAVMPFVKKNQCALINTSSSAIGLNYAGSNVFRLCPDDNNQAMALVSAAKAEGITAVIPIVRNDIWGNSLAEAFKTRFVAEGGFVYPGSIYATSETSFTSLASTIQSQVNQAVAAYGATKVAVLALTFSEIAGIFTAAIQYGELGSVKWYGCDGNASLDTLTSNVTLAAFALKTGFMSPIMGIGNAWTTPDFTMRLSEKIALQTGIVPDVTALSAYDATFIMGMAELQVGNTDMNKIIAMIPQVCDFYDKMGIERRLNVNGDQAKADYVFWKVMHPENVYYWDKFATYWADEDQFEYRWPL